MSLFNSKHDSRDSSTDSAASSSTADLLKILSKSDVILEDSLSASDLSLDATSDLLSNRLDESTGVLIRKVAPKPHTVLSTPYITRAQTGNGISYSGLKDVHTNRFVTKRTPRNRSISGPGKRGTRSQVRPLRRHTLGFLEKTNSALHPGVPQPLKRHMTVSKPSVSTVNTKSVRQSSCPRTRKDQWVQEQRVDDGEQDESNTPSYSLGFTDDLWSHSQADEIDQDPNLLDGSSKNSDQSAIATKVEELTPWERWLLQKEKIRRQELKRLRQKEANLRAKQAQAAASQAEKQQRSLTKCKEWLESKHRLLKEQNEAAAMARKEQLMKEQFKRESKKLESERKYALWCEQKKQEAKESAELIRQKEIAAAASAQRRREAAVAKFVDWMKSAQQRKPNPPVSYGYADGTVICYYDRSANPKPSYVNPNPWISPLEG
ncbi:hypothetical protein CRM22_009447 [Opisthorchis felineus]|uniref:Coiled-coil domain-containing protein n=1 Tax=Opisthorchis felineus TaxID=147828 RepID=A0A4S2L6Q3_OPIFE|nr:hypothetical protein CRM22_009447 [Opisthorchis felineus]